jgi:hypothetical protein
MPAAKGCDQPQCANLDPITNTNHHLDPNPATSSDSDSTSNIHLFSHSNTAAEFDTNKDLDAIHHTHRVGYPHSKHHAIQNKYCAGANKNKYTNPKRYTNTLANQYAAANQYLYDHAHPYLDPKMPTG